MNNKLAHTSHEINDLIKRRWSPRAFKDDEPTIDQMMSLLEAARWAPSSFNEQPWRFIVGFRDKSTESYNKVLSCLHEFNQKWAQSAPVLMLVCAKRTFSYKSKPNKHYMYDCGAAMANLSIQATDVGLHVHQMAGILPEKAVEVFAIPDDYQVITGVAIGYLGDAQSLEGDNQKSELAERKRKGIGEISFSNAWGRSFG